MGHKKQEYLRFKGKGEHSVNELEKIIEQREEELHLIKTTEPVNIAVGGVSKSFTVDEIVSELEDSDHLDDAIMFFKESSHLERK